jgi:4a-hydroxytetrahydrobiopterin dehydratase
MKKTADQHARNALVNIFVFPGLGSLRSGRRGTGLGQMGLVLAGTAMLLVWFYKEMSQYYGLMFGDEKQLSFGWIAEVGAALFVSSWLWSCVTSLSLFREASKGDPPPPPVLPAAKDDPEAAKIQILLAGLPQWKRHGDVITRTYEFEDFPAAMKFVNAVAAHAEQVQHHPDIDVRWNKVTLALTTHDAGGLTEKDFALAREADARSVG